MSIKAAVWAAIKEVLGTPYERIHDLALLREELGANSDTLAILRLVLADETGGEIPIGALKSCRTVNDVQYLAEAAEADAARELRAYREQIQRLAGAA